MMRIRTGLERGARAVFLTANVGALLIAGAGATAWGLQLGGQPATTGRHTAAPAPAMMGSMSMSMGSMSMSMGSMPMPMPAVHTGTRTISVASLVGPRTAVHMRVFTLIAQPARLRLGPDGPSVAAWTYNGTAPGPTLRVRQGDLVVVRLVNRLPVPTTIHWHGVAVPNGEDGVAGQTQDAVRSGQVYTYRFIARDAGTYWYHAHQDSLTQVARGLYGALVVAPATPPPGARDDVDVALSLHDWHTAGGDVSTVNSTAGALRVAARPGARVRLRFINTDIGIHAVTLAGAPFTVAALDGRDLHGPQPLAGTLLPIDAGQRYDVRFHMPAYGTVIVRVADDGRPGAPLALRTAVVVGSGSPPARLTVPHARFDLTAYGTREAPQSGAITLRTHVDASYTLRLGAANGFGLMQPGVRFTINGRASPDVTPIIVRLGEVVRVRIVNESDYIHPMHLHGHTLIVLARDGHPLRGSPVSLDTLDVLPGESYDVAFRADNPGVWMFHCHNLYHARHGMGLMVMYKGVATPFKEGGPAGNIPD